MLRSLVALARALVKFFLRRLRPTQQLEDQILWIDGRGLAVLGNCILRNGTLLNRAPCRRSVFLSAIGRVAMTTEQRRHKIIRRDGSIVRGRSLRELVRLRGRRKRRVGSRPSFRLLCRRGLELIL